MNKIIDAQSTARGRRLHNLGRMMRPASIVFIGGAQAAGAINACRRAGFKGQIWAVNPRRSEMAGVACVASLADLPGVPDAALLGLSPERSVEAVQALAAMGAGGAVCMSAGFAELGDHGTKLQRQLKQAAGDMAVLGPNCMGVMNLFDGAAVWGADNQMEPVGNKGAALISQSGAFAFGIANVERGFPLGYNISTGNQAVIDAADCIEAVLDDGRVRAIGLYLEGLNDGNTLGAACWRALQKGVPVVVLKGGDTPDGEAVAISHTGAMVVESDLWRAFAKRFGIAEVSSPKALVETLKFLTVSGVPAGERLSAVTFSGGLNGLIAAKAPGLGLSLPQPGPEGAASLRLAMPETVPVANPLDLNVPFSSKNGISMENGQAIANGITDLARGVADMVTFFVDVPRHDEKNLDAAWLPSMQHLGGAARELGLPFAVAGILPEGIEPELRQRLIEDGVSPLLGFGDALEALSVGAGLGYVQKSKQNLPFPALYGAAHEAGQVRMLDEAQSKDLLREFGLAMPQSVTATPAQAAQAAQQLGFPVAVKVLSHTIAHKAKMGGVRLGLKSTAEVTDAVADIQAAVAAAPGDHTADRFLIEQMIAAPVAEYIIGIKRQPALGLALMIGRGGVEVESQRQYQTLLLPLVDTDLQQALAAIGLTPTTHGYDAFRAAALSVASFAEQHQKTLQGLDVNPVIITASGEAIAADALAIMSH